MSARLPQTGGDEGKWGDILNEFLQVSHNSDGSLKPIDQSQVAGLSATLADTVITSDVRLSDERTPSDGSVTDAKVSSNAAISADKLADGVNNVVMTAAERSQLSQASAISLPSTLAVRDRYSNISFGRVYMDAGTPVNNNELTRKDYVDANGSATNADAATVSGTVDLSATVFAPPKIRVLTLSGNVTVSNNPSSLGAGRGGVLALTFKQPATGGPFTVTWPTMVWANGAAAPTMPTAANAELEVYLNWNGTAWRAKVGGTYFP